MKAQMIEYFTAEKQESVIFVLAGLAALAVSAWLYRSASPYRGMIGPLAIIAVIQIAVGGSIFMRTDAQVASSAQALDTAPDAFKRTEIARMERVMRGFQVYKAIEILILAAGIAMTFVFRNRLGLYSAGIGCIAQASLMLVLDLFAEHRGAIYLEALHRL